MSQVIKLAQAVIFVVVTACSAHAQKSEIDPIQVFNTICYTQVPAIRKIEDMATRLAWQQMGGEDLQQFASVENPDVLIGWDARVDKRLFRLGVIQSGLTPNFKEAFPAFADGTATGCTLVLDGQDDAQVLLDRMKTLAGKEPGSLNVPEGGLLTTTWAGGNEEFKVFLIMKSDDAGKASLLNVTILSKEPA